MEEKKRHALRNTAREFAGVTRICVTRRNLRLKS